ncbi:MAG: hypothetical protein LBS40_07830 [Burkholderiales bacterium]|jgi:hypothetical protein|nr:hypothetical protein [Burkholderiales bacterium]
MKRFKAAIIHLSVSFVITCIAVIWVRYILYPNYFFDLSGGLKLLSLVVVVNLAIGPLLTLIIYNEKKTKKALFFDLGTIIFFQWVALVYGLYTIWLARPVYNVFVDDRFIIIRNIDLEQSNLEKAPPPYNRLPWVGGPKLVATNLPDDSDEKLSLAFSGMVGYDIEHYPQYYVDYVSKKEYVLKKAKPIIELREKNGNASRQVENFLKKWNGMAEDYYYLPIKGTAPEFMTVVLTKSGDPITVLPIDPW